MATVTPTDCAEFIKKLGFEPLTDIEVTAFIETADSKDADFAAAAYSDTKIQLIKLYLVALQSINGVRQTSSVGLDVMNKSYKYGTLQETFDWLLGKITDADTAGAVTDILPSGATGSFMMTVGGCYE